MPLRLPPLETARLRVRPLTLDDLDDIHRLLDVELRGAFGSEDAKTREERRQWLRWTILGYEEFARLFQPPYGERAIVLRATGRLIGACGFVPCLNAFGLLPGFAPTEPGGLYTAEFGLFYAIAPAHQRQGYASEAVKAMIDWAFAELRLRRIVATTGRRNVASIGVMRRVGMRVVENPHPEPPWLQVVGILEHGTARP
jgi:RimJ/RimL family protein N-acetyltransferase